MLQTMTAFQIALFVVSLVGMAILYLWIWVQFTKVWTERERIKAARRNWKR